MLGFGRPTDDPKRKYSAALACGIPFRMSGRLYYTAFRKSMSRNLLGAIVHPPALKEFSDAVQFIGILSLSKHSVTPAELPKRLFSDLFPCRTFRNQRAYKLQQ